MQHRLGVMVRPEMHQTATSDTDCYKIYLLGLFYYYIVCHYYSMIDHSKFFLLPSHENAYSRLERNKARSI